MGHQIIKCPDGTLAVFSTGTDTWIMWNATPAELEDYYARKAAEAARLGTREIIEQVLAGEPRKAYFQFALTFREANTTSVKHGGEDLAKSPDSAAS